MITTMERPFTITLSAPDPALIPWEWHRCPDIGRWWMYEDERRFQAHPFELP